MSNDCISCQSRPGTTPQGLCEPCHDDLRFVVRPTAHRETERRADASDPAIRELERQGIAVIQIWPETNDLWICDFCNNQILVDDDITLVPVLGTWALCPSCVTTISYWPDAWTHPTPRACPCDACQLPLFRARQQLARSTRPYGIEDLGIT